MGVQHNNNDMKGEHSVNGPEKFGVSVAEQPSDKVEYLPIKKRRPRLRTPSPSDPAKVADSFVEVQKGRCVEKENALVNAKLPYTEESYGIELLATAACESNYCNDVDNAKRGSVEDKLLTPSRIGTSMDMPLLGKTFAFSKGDNSFSNNSMLRAHDDTPGQINSSAVLLNPLNNTDTDAQKCTNSGKVVRLHWDLNTVMDDWDQPTDDLNIGSRRNSKEEIYNEDLHGTKSEKFHSCARVEDSESTWQLLKCTSGNEGPALKLEYLESSPFPEHNPASSIPSSGGKINTSSMELTVPAGGDHCTSGIQLERTLSLKNVHFEEQDNTIILPADSDKDVCEMASIKTKEEYAKLFDVSSNEFFDADISLSRSGRASSHVPSEHKNFSPLATTMDENQHLAVDINKEKCNTAPPNIATQKDSSSDVEMKEILVKSHECAGEVTMEDLLDDGDVSDISLGGHDKLVRLQKVTKRPAGCESPFEDGELRESVALSWEENECETECLDYDIDDRDPDDVVTANHCMSEAGSDSIKNGNNVNLMEKGTCGSVSSFKESSNSASVGNVSGQDQLGMAVEANDTKTDEIVASDPIHRLGAKGSFSEEVRSRVTREKLSSHVGELPASDAHDENDILYMQQGRSGPRRQAGQVFRSDKHLGRDRRYSQMEDERHKNNFISAPSRLWDSGNNYQSGYRRGGGHLRPRSTIPASEGDFERLSYNDLRRSTDYSMKGVYRPVVRRAPPDNSEDDCGMHRGSVERRDSHGRSRGKSGIYRQEGFKGPRGSHHGPISNEPAPSSVWMPARRQRSSSPVLDRNPSFSRPCKKSRSRSRPRSPLAWHLREERNADTRRISRSSDFKPEARMERTRMHYEDSKYAGNGDDILSPPRKRFSSQGQSSWLNDRNGEFSSFSGRNSPGRFFVERERFYTRGPVERMKSDPYFGPRAHTQRFSKPSGDLWRGKNYDDNDKVRAKHSDSKYEMIHRVRHSETSGTVRRFRNGAEDCFDDRNTQNDNSWEGRGPFKYDSSRM